MSISAGLSVQPPELPGRPELGGLTMMSYERAAPAPWALPVSCTEAGAAAPTARMARAMTTANPPQTTLIHHHPDR